MNRFRWVVLMGLVALCVTTTAGAQYRTGRVWVVGSGIAFPMGPDAFSDLWKSGFVLNAGVHHSLNVEQRILVRALASYHRLSASSNTFLDEIGVVDPDARVHVASGSGSILTLLCQVKVTPRWTEGRVVPYLVGGPSIMRVAQDATFTRAGSALGNEQINESNTDFGWGVGAGLDIQVADDLTVFVEGQYEMVFTQEAGPRFLPIRLGVMF